MPLDQITAFNPKSFVCFLFVFVFRIRIWVFRGVGGNWWEEKTNWKENSVISWIVFSIPFSFIISTFEECFHDFSVYIWSGFFLEKCEFIEIEYIIFVFFSYLKIYKRHWVSNSLGSMWIRFHTKSTTVYSNEIDVFALPLCALTHCDDSISTR